MRTVIWGSPCSGKTTYVKDNAKPGDLVFDYDALYEAISFLPSKTRSPGLKSVMFELSDAVYEVIEKHPELDAWIITATKDKARVESLVKRFDATLVYLEIDREEAHERCDKDSRPETWHSFIDEWFDAQTGEKVSIAKAQELAESGDLISKVWKAANSEIFKKKAGKMEKKSFNTELEFKEDADQTGQFKAVFSWFDVVDKHGDVTLPGAFEDGSKVKIAYWGHRWENLPVGRGEIHQDEEKAWVDAKFFMDTEAGLETYKTVKNLGELQEWSYGFETLESSDDTKDGQKVRVLKKLKTFEISPVFIGAGNNTQTLTIKSEVTEPGFIVEQEVKTESETVEVGNESGVDPADVKLLIEIIALEAEHE